MKPKPRAISNTSFISVMHDIGYLNPCSEAFERVYIPKSVHDEAEQSGMDPLKTSLKEQIRKKFIAIKECSNTALVNSLKSFLGSGEAETVALALELKEAEFVIRDDLKARNLFRRLDTGKRPIGTIGILKFMHTRRIIKEDLDTVRFRFKRHLFQNC